MLSTVHSHGRTQVPTKRGGLEQLDGNSSLKLLVSKCPRECNGFEESSSNVSRSPATFLIKPRTKLQGVSALQLGFPRGRREKLESKTVQRAGFSAKT